MADKVIDVPGLGVVSFPSDMADDAISNIIRVQTRPGPAAPPIPQGLQPYQSNLPGPMKWFDENVMEPGIDRASQGITGIGAGNFARGTSDVIRGMGQALSPAALMNPARAAIAIPAGLMGQQLTEQGLTPYIGPDRAALAGDVAGMGVGGAASRINPLPVAGALMHPRATAMNFLSDLVGNVIDKYKPQAPVEPFRPSPNVSRLIKFGGPAPEEAGPAGSLIPRKGWAGPPPIEEPTPQAPAPFKPNPKIRGLIKATPSSGAPGMPNKPGTIIPRKGWAGPPDEEGVPKFNPVPEGPSSMVRTPDTVQGQSPLQPIDKFEMNRMAHARAQEMEIPGSPAGKSGHNQLSVAAKNVFGVKSWSELNVREMKAIHDFMQQNNRLPLKGEIQE